MSYKIKEIKMFKCKKCNKIYEDLKTAENCFNKHAISDNLEIIKTIWNSSFNLRFPGEIFIQDKSFSGILAQYKLIDSGAIEFKKEN